MFFFNYSENILRDYDNSENELFVNKNLTVNSSNSRAYDHQLELMKIDGDFYFEFQGNYNYGDYMSRKRYTIREIMEFLGILK